jgi:hypothetical protein
MKGSLCLALSLLALACAEAQPTTASLNGNARLAPPKCASCHLAPREHSLATTRWPEFQRSHRRRIHLTDEEKVSLYDFLIGGAMPTDAEGAQPGR